jgi:hypothetical protein
MGLLTKSDLIYTYSWTAIPGDDPRVSGEPDSTLFNRHEGYEVLYLINKYASMHSLYNKADGLKAEKLINTKLPSDVRSQIKVKEWLHNHWND